MDTKQYDANEKILGYMEAVMNANLALFMEYSQLANKYKKEGNNDAFEYWDLRSMDLSNTARKLRNDIRRLESI